MPKMVRIRQKPTENAEIYFSVCLAHLEDATNLAGDHWPLFGVLLKVGE